MKRNEGTQDPRTGEKMAPPEHYERQRQTAAKFGGEDELIDEIKAATDEVTPTADKRDVILQFASNPDAVLNALHQAGWRVVPKLAKVKEGK
jgi:hypothetical protein